MRSDSNDCGRSQTTSLSSGLDRFNISRTSGQDVTTRGKMRSKRARNKTKLRVLSCAWLAFYVVSFLVVRVHLLNEAHLTWEISGVAQSGFTVEADDDLDDHHHHHPHPAADHESPAASISSCFQSENFAHEASILLPLFAHDSETLLDVGRFAEMERDIPGPSPPELICGWQFFLRAALPARAPSISA